MWQKLAVASALLLLQGVAAQNCPYTVSVLDVDGVQCVTAAPCSGTYYASGLSQGVGACPTGTSCALLPLTPIMGCAASGRSDLTYVNADGTLTKDGKTVTLSGDSSATSSTESSKLSSSSSSKTSSSSSSKTGSASSSKDSSSSGSSTSSTSGSNASSGSGSVSSSSDGNSPSSSSSGTNSGINPRTVIAGGSDSGNSTSSDATSASSSNSTSNSWTSESDSGSYTISPGSSSANQQAEFNPGSILSDGSKSSDSSSQGGLGLGSIICIVVGCLAVVAIAAGARLLKKGKETEGELETPAGALEDYNGGGGGGGMTPKENVLLL